MKAVTLSLATMVVLFVFAAFRPALNDYTPQDSQAKLEIPENIQAILDKSCTGCHNSESQNSKAKMKLKLDQLTSMSVSKQVSKLSKIAKTVEKGKMPTKKFKEHYPDRMPTDDERKELIDWARNTANRLLGDN